LLWGKLKLKPSERKSGDLGSSLLRAMIFFLHASFMEHPAFPKWLPQEARAAFFYQNC
jgi:hypothetical protein